MPKSKLDHVVPDIPLERIKDRLSQVRGALVECPLVSPACACVAYPVNDTDACDQDFLIDQKDFVEGPMWSGFDPTLPIYI